MLLLMIRDLLRYRCMPDEISFLMSSLLTDFEIDRSKKRFPDIRYFRKVKRYRCV